MQVSVIIPVFNEEKNIGECLTSLFKQSHKDFEVIVVDDGSTDKTLEVLRNFQFSTFSFQFLEQKHRGAGGARNLGAKMARGEVLVFVDADMTFDKNFLRNLVKPILEGKVKGTFSKDEYVSNWENTWARCLNIQEGWQEERRHPKNYPDRQPVFRAILKSEFDKVGGFTPGGYDDDWSLAKKLGYSAVATDGAVFYHKNPDTLNEVFRQARWIGKRKYKLGFIGVSVALVRSSLPFSVVIGIYKSFRHSFYAFLLFKVVYDFGIFVGILERILTGKVSK